MSEGAAAELEIRGLSKSYGDFRAVDDLSLSVAKGEFITILGASGSGKTTTLMMIAGFDYPSVGEILFRGRAITYMPPHLRNIGMVFQSYALFPHLTVFDNIAFPLKLRRLKPPDVKIRVAAALGLVRLAPHATKHPAQLSGGQQQRVALARALVFGRVTILSVTHDQDEALAMSDRIVVMDKGRVEVVGSPLSIYERPASRMVAEFMKETNILHGRIVAVDGETARVELPGGVEIRTAHNGLGTTGAQVMCCLRPERIRLGKEAGLANVRSASIQNKVYLGDVVKFHVALPGMEGKLAVKALATDAMRFLMPGDTVDVSWDDGDVQILAA